METGIEAKLRTESFLKSLPSHLCAYCGSPETEINFNSEETTDGLFVFTVYCRSCKREDLPGIRRVDMLKLIRFS